MNEPFPSHETITLAIARVVHRLIKERVPLELAEEAAVVGVEQTLPYYANLVRKDAFAAYVWRCATRHLAKEAQAAGPRIPASGAWSNASEPVQMEEDRTQLHKCFANLTPMQQAAIHSKFSDDGDSLPVQAYGMPPGTESAASPEAVRKSRQYALANLRKCLVLHGVTDSDLFGSFWS